MSEHGPVPAPRPVPPGPDRAPDRAPAGEGHGLSTAKVAGQALAAVTTAGVGAVLGGASGTVAGAALASVVTTVGDAVYQRSLERTGHRVRRSLRARQGRADPADATDATDATDAAAGDPLPPPGAPDPELVGARPEPEPRLAAVGAVGASPTAVTLRMRPVGAAGGPRPGEPGGPGGTGGRGGTAQPGRHVPPPAPDDTPTSFIPPVDRTTALGAGPGTRVLPGGDPAGDPRGREHADGPDDPDRPDDPYGPDDRPGDDPDAPSPRPARPWVRYAVLAGTALVIFLVAMIAITGIERIKGSPLSGGTGTSVGEVFGTRDATPTATTGADAGDETSATTTPGRASATPAPRQDRGTTTARTPARTSAPAAATPTPTP